MGFQPPHNTVDIVIDSIFILDWMNKILESRQEMEEKTSDALKKSYSSVTSAFNAASIVFRMGFQFPEQHRRYRDWIDYYLWMDRKKPSE